MLGFQECCDAIIYSDLGKICSQRGYIACSMEYRPLGSLALNSFMWPNGVAPLSHGLLLAFSLYMLAIEGVSYGRKWNLPNIRTVIHDKQALLHIQQFVLKALGLFLLLEFMFMGLASVNLTDAPAGIFAALAIIGFHRKNALIFALAAGVSVLVRAAYLYPMLALVTYFVLESSYKRIWSKVAISILFFICLIPQYYVTYKHLGVFSYLDPSKVEYWRNFHFLSNFAGYDTLVSPIAGHPWQSGTSFGLMTAFKQQQWMELFRLLVSRIDFYFASFVPLGKVYLNSANERIFSPIVSMAHCVALIMAYLYLKAHPSAWRIWVPLAIILTQNLLIIPEQRFNFVIQLFLVVFLFLYSCRIVERKIA